MNNSNDINNTSILLKNKLQTNQSDNKINPNNENLLHQGHETMHLIMIFILFFALIAVQVLVLKWKQTAYRSYFYTSFFGLALVPLFLAFAFQFTRFITLWGLFALFNSWVIYRASRKPLQSKTPRLVYQWFAIVYKVCYAIGLIGYLLLILCIFGIPSIFLQQPEDAFGFAILCMFYGLYFGVLGRDLVHILSEKMACSLGYFALDQDFPKKHLRPNICAICDDYVDPTIPTMELEADYSLPRQPSETSLISSSSSSSSSSKSGTHGIVLPCTHTFHEFCLKGWTILGKRDMCPFCKEKVDYRSVLPLHPWDKAQLLYFHLIDAMRYLVVWNPLVFILVQLLFKLFGLS